MGFLPDFFEKATIFLPIVSRCCFSINLFVGGILSSVYTLVYFTGHIVYISMGFKSTGLNHTDYYTAFRGGRLIVNEKLSLGHLMLVLPLLVFTFCEILFNVVFFLDFFADIPNAWGLGLVFFAMLSILFEINWILVAVIRAFYGGGAFFKCADYTICPLDFTVLLLFIGMILAIYCLIIIRSFILYDEDKANAKARESYKGQTYAPSYTSYNRSANMPPRRVASATKPPYY